MRTPPRSSHPLRASSRPHTLGLPPSARILPPHTLSLPPSARTLPRPTHGLTAPAHGLTAPCAYPSLARRVLSRSDARCLHESLLLLGGGRHPRRQPFASSSTLFGLVSRALPLPGNHLPSPCRPLRAPSHTPRIPFTHTQPSSAAPGRPSGGYTATLCGVADTFCEVVHSPPSAVAYVFSESLNSHPWHPFHQPRARPTRGSVALTEHHKEASS
jgi:hypothetical protein